MLQDKNFATQRRLKAICDLVTNNKYYNECIEGAVNVVIDFWGADLKDQASEFCSILKQDTKNYCYQILAGRLPNIISEVDKRAEICSTFEKDYQYMCRAS